jgi:S-DNA-T family DNA segregation ATPase FtsK/SpoIIIE
MSLMAERKRIKKTSDTQKPRSDSKKENIYSQTMRREIWGVVITAAGIILALGFYFDAAAVIGEGLKTFCLGLFGNVAYALPVFVTAHGIYTVLKNNARVTYSIAATLFGILADIGALIHIFSDGAPDSFVDFYSFGTLGIGGGLIGGSIATALDKTIGWGSIVILISLLIIMLIILTGLSLTSLSSALKERIKAKINDRAENQDMYDTAPPAPVIKQPKKPPLKKPLLNSTETEADLEIPDIKIFSHDQLGLSDIVSEPVKPSAPNAPEDKPAGEVKNEPLEKIVAVPASEIEKEIERQAPPPEYKIPPIDFLENHKVAKDASGKPEDLRESAKKLIDTLKSFGVEAKVLEVSRGPSVTRFELQPSAGVKVSKIVNLADDIALNLAAFGVRIEAPIPGKAAIGIEIPNKSVAIVPLRSVIASKEFQSFKSKTAFALGKDISGKPIIGDVSKMPHLLIAGTTGSGKSVSINTLIASIIYKASPAEVKLLMIDPKVVELGVYNGIPHLLIPVVTDPRKAAGALNWAVTEMTRRYKLFADCNVRDISGYNDYAKEDGLSPLEKIIIIIDELSDLMMVAPHDVEDAICRLAQMARAAGMHLVVATQRPSVDVITGLIKANIPSRIAFATSNQIDSRTILDMTGAEKLLGRGDMLYLPVGASKPTRIQGAFISDKEVEHVVEYIKSGIDMEYDEDILETIENGTSEKNSKDDADDNDILLPDAIEVVVECGQASVSLIQRRLKVGYSRAGRLVDQMEARGIVGPHEGSKPRQVLITKQQFYEMTMLNES